MSDCNKKLKSNIWKYILFEVLWVPYFFLPIYQMLLLSRNISIFQMALIGIAWELTRLVTEIPSGVLADKWGRKKVLILSQVFLLIDLMITMFAQTFWLFILSATFSGLWFACYSGTGFAFFYDTLVGLDREDEYETLSGRMGFITMPSGVIFPILSSFLFVQNICLKLVLNELLQTVWVKNQAHRT